MPPTIHASDPWHVIEDALSALLDAIDRDEDQPWTDYAQGPDAADDPKATRAGYLAVLEAARTIADTALTEA